MVSYTHRSSKVEQGGKIIQDTATSGMKEQIVGKLEQGSCQRAKAQAVIKVSKKHKSSMSLQISTMLIMA